MSEEELENVIDYIDSQPTKKTNGKRNRLAGNNEELRVIKKLITIGFKGLITSRFNSRHRDNAKVDIMYKDESISGRLPYNFQVKTLAKPCAYGKLLKEMPEGKEVNVVLHKQTKKDVSGRFQKVGEYAILNAEDFYDLIEIIQHFRNKQSD